MKFKLNKYDYSFKEFILNNIQFRRHGAQEIQTIWKQFGQF